MNFHLISPLHNMSNPHQWHMVTDAYTKKKQVLQFKLEAGCNVCLTNDDVKHFSI